MGKKILLSALGMLIGTLGVSVIIKANAGAGPWDAAYMGIVSKFGLSYGIWTIVVQFLMVIINALLMKERLRLETMIPVVVWWLAVDFWTKSLLKNASLFTNSHLIQWASFIVGLVILGFGIAMYVASGLPRMAYDALMVNLTVKLNKGYGIVRTGLEATGGIIAFIFGGPLGLGSLLVVLGLGIFIHTFSSLVNLYKRRI